MSRAQKDMSRAQKGGNRIKGYPRSVGSSVERFGGGGRGGIVLDYEIHFTVIEGTYPGSAIRPHSRIRLSPAPRYGKHGVRYDGEAPFRRQ